MLKTIFRPCYFNIFSNLQGQRKGRTKTTGLLQNLEMRFRCCIRAHIDHKIGTFDYQHQDSHIFHFKIHSDTLLIILKSG